VIGRPRRAGAAALLLLAAATIGASDAWLSTRGDERSGVADLMYLPNGRFLKVASLGHSTFVADLIYIWSIQYYGTWRGEERFEFLDHVYSTVLARLDPQFLDPYLIGSLIMIVERRDLEAGLKLLDQGMVANPGAWLLPYEAGFYAYDIGKDHARAARYFETAMRIPGAPPSTRRLYAEMVNRQGDKQTSLALWREVFDGATDDRVRVVAANHIHDLAIEVDVARFAGALRAYRERHGRNPGSLDALRRAGLLPEIPLDPDGSEYLYDPLTGEARPAAAFRLRRR